MKRKHSYVMPLLLLLVITISIGYAALSTTLNINGTSTITKQTWNVYFDTLTVTSGSVTPTTAAAISSDKQTVTYTVPLTKPGEFYEFSVVVKNAGTLPAKISATPTLSGVSTAQDVYVNYTVKWSDNTTIAAGDTIAAGATKTAKVRVEYDKNITASQLPTADQTLSLKFSMNFVQG